MIANCHCDSISGQTNPRGYKYDDGKQQKNVLARKSAVYTISVTGQAP